MHLILVILALYYSLNNQVAELAIGELR